MRQETDWTAACFKLDGDSVSKNSIILYWLFLDWVCLAVIDLWIISRESIQFFSQFEFVYLVFPRVGGKRFLGGVAVRGSAGGSQRQHVLACWEDGCWHQEKSIQRSQPSLIIRAAELPAPFKIFQEGFSPKIELKMCWALLRISSVWALWEVSGRLWQTRPTLFKGSWLPQPVISSAWSNLTASFVPTE